MEIKQADRIADALEEMVFSGRFEEGERLDETSLAEFFGVSRTPIREALQRLVVAQLAEQRPRRGVFVRQTDPQTLTEMFETMAEIEAVCGRLAAQKVSAENILHLRATNALCMQAIENNDCDSYSRQNEDFHAMIYDLSGNAFLAGEARRLYCRLKPFRRVQLQLNGRMAQSMSEHEALIEALSLGDGVAAACILRNHVGPQGRVFDEQMALLRHEVANRNAG